MVSGRGRAVIYARGWGPVSSARIVARCAISDERAYAQKQRHRMGGGGGGGGGGLGDNSFTVFI